MLPPVVREEVDIRTDDGVLLRATVVSPLATRPRATVVLAHAMFARRTEFEKPTPEEGWLRAFAMHGARAIAFDFRGHGDSGKAAAAGGFWAYDDLVERDLPAVVAAAAARAEGHRLVVVGHSLGGHVTVAAAAAGHIAVDAIVTVATNVWMPSLEPSLPRRLVKQAALRSMKEVTARVGYFPARRLRQGSDDEAAPYVHDLARFFETDRWTSGDGRVDFREAMKTLAARAMPVLAVSSRADRLNCVPECAARWLAPLGATVEHFVVGSSDDGTSAPTHMGLVTSAGARSVRDKVVRWAVTESPR